MKRTPTLIALVGGMLLLHRLIPIHVVQTGHSLAIYAMPHGSSALPADDAGSDDSDDDDSDDAK